MLAGLTLALTLAVSGTLLLFASRCVNAKQYHLPQPGVLACHRHLPVSHVPLWRVVTTSLVPSGLLLLGWWLKRWAVRPLGWGGLPLLCASGSRCAVGRRHCSDPPPNFLVQALADGLAGGQPTFG